MALNEDIAYNKIINCTDLVYLKVMENIYLKPDEKGRIHTFI
jgi:hypothetical protein